MLLMLDRNRDPPELFVDYVGAYCERARAKIEILPPAVEQGGDAVQAQVRARRRAAARRRGRCHNSLYPVGCRVRRRFDAGIFEGEVVDHEFTPLVPCADGSYSGGDPTYGVLYEDGDREDLTARQLGALRRVYGSGGDGGGGGGGGGGGAAGGGGGEG